MSLGLKATILIGVGVLVVAGLFVALFRPLISGLKKAPVTNSAPAAAVKESPPAVEGPPTATTRSATESEKAAASLRTTAILFAERYGTYSARGNFENITDLYPLMTERMRASSDAFITEARARENREGVGVSGTTTRALDTEVITQTPLSAAVLVNTQRTETASDGRETVTYQKLELTLVRSGELWKVDSAAWQTVR